MMLNSLIDHNQGTLHGQNTVHDPEVGQLRAQAKTRFDAANARTHQPKMVPHTDVPKRSIHTPLGFAAMVHSIAHIEWNAIRLALDAVWRFDGMPLQYYQEWMQVADEESQHFELLQTLLQDLGYSYGDFTAHDGLWHMCEVTAHDVVARMALVPRTLEARGLDATPLVQAKLLHIRGSGQAMALRAHGILDIILRDEIGHVAVGNHWYRWLCRRDGLDPIAHYKQLALAFDAPRMKPPINRLARLQAGFVAEELDAELCTEVKPHADAAELVS